MEMNGTERSAFFVLMLATQAEVIISTQLLFILFSKKICLYQPIHSSCGCLGGVAITTRKDPRDLHESSEKRGEKNDPRSGKTLNLPPGGAVLSLWAC